MTAALTRPWREDIMYMILVDRFHRGGQPSDIPQKPFYGGNIAGILEKLDYLQNLGITALWLSPIYKNQSDGFHGYWPIDFFETDPRFGTMAELKGLIDECHRRGVKVLLDKVFNHVGYTHPMASDPKYHGWFNKEWDIRWVDQKKLEVGSLHGLPDFDHHNPAVRKYLIDKALWWIDQTGADGFRLDAVKHVPILFWKEFSAEIHKRAGPDFLLLGEVFRGIPEYLARYVNGGGIDGAFDVPFADVVRSALTRDSETPGPNFFQRVNALRKEYKTMLYNEVIRRLFARQSNDMRWFSHLIEEDGIYQHPELLAPIIDNHDLARFTTEAGGSHERLKMALTMLLTWRGIPVITYGTECGMEGRTEGSNRTPMTFGKNPEIADFMRKLIHLRKSNPVFTHGKTVEVSADREVFAYLRVLPGSPAVLVVVNNSREVQERSLDIPDSVKEGSVWKDLLDGKTYSMKDEELDLKLPPRSAAVLSL